MGYAPTVIEVDSRVAADAQLVGIPLKLVRTQQAMIDLYTVGWFLNGGSFSKASATPIFLEDENIFQKLNSP
jgi:hypothetical protein